MATAVPSGSTNSSQLVQEKGVLNLKKQSYCSWTFFKPILIGLGLLLASLTTLALVVASGTALSVGIGIVLSIQVILACLAIVFFIHHIREFKKSRQEQNTTELPPN